MNEGDPKVVQWQVDYETNSVGLTDKVPDGFVAAGPWFPFAVAVLNDREDGDYACRYYRRPLVRAEEWTPLASLPPGTLFETQNGEQGVKLAVAAAEPECVRVAWLSGGEMSTQTGGFLVRRIPLP